MGSGNCEHVSSGWENNMMIRTLIALFLTAVVLSPLRAAEPKKLTADELQGTWLFDAASRASEKDSLAVV